jgi:hypothetical protein
MLPARPLARLPACPLRKVVRSPARITRPLESLARSNHSPAQESSHSPAQVTRPLKSLARLNHSRAQLSHTLYYPARSANLLLRSQSHTAAHSPNRLLYKFVRSSAQLPLPLTQLAHYLAQLSRPIYCWPLC